MEKINTDLKIGHDTTRITLATIVVFAFQLFFGAFFGESQLSVGPYLCYENPCRKQDFYLHLSPDLTKADKNQQHFAHLPSKSSAILVGFDEAMEDSIDSGEVGLET